MIQEGQYIVMTERVINKKNPLISVIVPIYKVELHLKKCVDSILNQTYSNIEVILIDDGSPDNCGMMCDEYVNTDERVVVIHQKNQGLSMARNNGIDIAKGEYITFIDSDDYIDIDMIEVLIRLIKKYGANIASCDYYYMKNGKDIKKCIEHKEECVDDIQSINYLYQWIYIYDMAWCRLYKRDIFKKIKFCKGIGHEDTYLSVDILNEGKKIAYTTEKKYYYIQHANSYTNNKNISNKQEDLILALKHRHKRLTDLYPNLKEEHAHIYYMGKLFVLEALIRSMCNKVEVKAMIDEIKLDSKEILKNYNIPSKFKIFVISLYIGTPMAQMLIQLKDRYKQNH